MKEFITRQLALIRQAMLDYREDRSSLNTLIQRIEGVSSAIDIGEWRDAIFPIIVEIEQINAFALDLKRSLNAEEKSEVESYLTKLDTLIDSFGDKYKP